MSRRKRSKGQAGRILGALWMPLVAVIVIAVVGFGVNRIREKSQAISHPADDASGFRPQLSRSIPRTSPARCSAIWELAGKCPMPISIANPSTSC